MKWRFEDRISKQMDAIKKVGCLFSLFVPCFDVIGSQLSISSPLSMWLMTKSVGSSTTVIFQPQLQYKIILMALTIPSLVQPI